MELTIAERINVLSILPEEANFITLKIIRDLQDEMSFSEKEIKDYDIKTQLNNGRAMTGWNGEGEKAVKKCKIGEKAEDLIREELEKRNKESKLTANLFTLYEKFVIKESKK